MFKTFRFLAGAALIAGTNTTATAFAATHAFDRNAEACSSPTPPVGTTAGMSNADIIYINWDGEIAANLDAMLPVFYSELLRSDYLGEIEFMYGGLGSSHNYRGEYTLIPQTYVQNGCTVETPCSLNWSQIQTEVHNFISRDNLPTSNTIYMVHLPPNYNLFDSSGTQQCAYHVAIGTGVLNAGAGIPVAIMSDFTLPTSFCATGTNEIRYPTTDTASYNNVTLVASHEFIESLVDPKGNGQEIGDPCDCAANEQNGVAWMTFQGATRPWFVQQPWEAGAQTCFAGSDPMPQSINSSGAFAARTPNNLDGFFSSQAGTVATSAWAAGGSWNNFTVSSNTPIVQGSPIAATARTGNNLDIFYVGSDGAVWTNAWQFGGPWIAFPISGTNLAPPGASISALTRGANSLDVFVVDNNGNLDRLSWAGSGWSLSFAGAGDIQPGAGVAAVARTTGNLDVFFIGKDGGLYTTFLYPGWTSWERVRVPTPEHTVSGSSVAVTARAWTNLDVFLTDETGALEHPTWNPDTGWTYEITGFSVPSGAQLAAVARYPTDLDTFFVDGSGVQNVWWHGSNPWGLTTSLNNGSPLQLTSGQSVSAVARTSNNLDLFLIGTGFIFGIPVRFTDDVSWSSGNPWGQTIN
jgi:hypothetical protein